ncbi:IS110 family transposase [Streptomyces sp. NPDC054775]
MARGERVIDVPATATSPVRELSRGGGRKNDQIDAAAAATMAHLHGDGRKVETEDHSTALALLDERRASLAQARVRAVNQLHALLRDLLPGGAPEQMSADQAAALLRTIRPAGLVEKVRKGLARDLVAEVRASTSNWLPMPPTSKSSWRLRTAHSSALPASARC